MAKEGSESLNEIRDILRMKQAPDLSHLIASVSRTATIYQQELGKRLRKYARYGFFDRRPVIFSMITIPFWADLLMDNLINTVSLTRKEAKKAEQLLGRQGLRQKIPNLYVRMALETILSLKQQRETANDHIDIVRLCTAIPFVDIILTDKSKAFDIKALGFDNDFKVGLFSGSRDGLLAFKGELDHIVND